MKKEILSISPFNDEMLDDRFKIKVQAMFSNRTEYKEIREELNAFALTIESLDGDSIQASKIVDYPNNILDALEKQGWNII